MYVTERQRWDPPGTEITADSDSPNRTGRVSIEHARQQIATYGRDNLWVTQGDALRKSANLLTALTQTTYTCQGDNLLLERKADLKARIGFSPDAF